MRTALVAVCVLAVANAAFAQKATYVAANIVDTWDKCPVKKPTSWDVKVFDSSLDSLSALTEYTDKLSKDCQTSLMSLANCASDNDAFATPPSEVTSLSTSDGCCLSDCAKSIKETVALGCFDSLLTQICGNAKLDKYKTGLFNAGVRCANFDAACPGAGKVAAKVANATAAAKTAVTAAAGNATAAAKTAVTAAAGNATAAVKDAAAATKDAVAGAVAKVTGGAAATAVSAAAAAVVGAAALLML